MKKQLIILLTAAFVLPVLSQETNEFHGRRGDVRRPDENKRERPEWTEAQRKEHMERRYQFMEKALSEIGVSDEEKIKINELQEAYRKKMKETSERVKTARVTLSKLLDNGATDEEIDAAIKDVSVAQTEQLRLLVAKRREMEKLLGREKYSLFMQNARMKFHEYGRRSGSGMPPRPGPPPIPNAGNKSKLPPMPNDGEADKLPPMPSPPQPPE